MQRNIKAIKLYKYKRLVLNGYSLANALSLLLAHSFIDSKLNEYIKVIENVNVSPE